MIISLWSFVYRMSTVLDRNLAALSRHNAVAAEQIRQSAPIDGLEWTAARDGAESASVAAQSDDGRLIRITLASRHQPLTDAEQFAAKANLNDHGTIIVLGFGLGYHVSKLADRVAGKGLLAIYEPDAGLMRSVLERIDYSTMFARGVLLLLGSPDEAEMTRRFEPHASLITQGVEFLSHAPTRRLHETDLTAFTEKFTKVVAFVRTTMATTLVNAALTCRNLAHNIGHYAAGATVNELAGAAAGYPAVLVSAGPSLAKNVALLSEPGMRERVVIIAVQTVLKPLLDRGIRPHFVTALDYHEISARFYEGLPPLPDVTLVAEAKAHHAILDAYPGPIRILQNSFLDRLLGPLHRPIKPMKPGSTVAHLSFYLAQHLGCDPIIFIGQDLGFSDGLYYSPGTAIHDVWAPELGVFNTIEMMEWQRIARHKAHLQKRTDVHGRPIYSDEQMLTYLAQFERDFAQASQTIIDATEGGLPKQHAAAMTLRAALDLYALRPLTHLPQASTSLDAQRLALVDDHLRRRLEQVKRFRNTSEQTLPLLRHMIEDQRDHAKMDRLFDQLEKRKREVAELQEAFTLVNDLNQIGLFKRVRADRAIEAGEHEDPYLRQARQLDRDIDNVQWLVDSCTETLEILHESISRLKTQKQQAAAERGAA